ncbi:sodium:solute symporter family transporter [Natronogracilivirga saccharolytica]|uniref:Sodium:solute symporter n=1 Tax=Natronogracilivirga saccharolytica TaxID=2812953 RepID=A0A8J7UWE4_9BACT|nr:sodium:solute symporter [Natronogracilivirga saccharolytica]
MHTIDLIVIALYMVALVAIGLIAKRKAGASADSYFLGNRKMSWWMLGSSGMASNLDVSGTLIIVAFIYAIGIQGLFIEIRGGVVLIMAFLMIFMGKWNRRAQVMTVAEWMKLRFGSGPQGNLARLLSAIANIAFAIATITYFAQGAGIFLGSILDIDPRLASVMMIFVASIYTVASGLYGVIYTDVFQGFLIFFTIIYVCILAFVQFDLPEEFLVSVPMLDGTFKSIETSLSDWGQIIPSWTMDLPGEYARYNLFGIAILFYLFKSTIEGSGGTGGYQIQRYFAAKSDREAGLLSLFWIGLMAFRWPFVVAIAMLGINIGLGGSVIANPEEVLPIVIMNELPVVITGLLVAGLVAAAMSTFDSVVNAGAAYWVKDIYHRFLNRRASERQLVIQSRVSSAVLILVGLLMTFFFRNLNDIWAWITMGLGAGLIVPQIIRWYWWRFNGYGFAFGTLAGMILAIGQRLVAPEIPEYMSFIFIAGGTFVISITVTLLTTPTESTVLTKFYKITRPFGFWGPVRSCFRSQDIQKINAENRRDILATFIAVPWQIILFLTPMSFMTQQWGNFFALTAVLLVLSVGLYFAWFRHLSTIDRGREEEPVPVSKAPLK